MWIKIPGHIYDGLFEEEDREMRKRKQLLDHVFEASHVTIKDSLFASYHEVEGNWKHAFVTKGSKPNKIYIVYQGAVSIIGHQSFPVELPDPQIPLKPNYKIHSHKHAVLGSQFVLGLHESRLKTPFEYDILIEDSNTILFSFDSDFFWMLVKTDWGCAKSVREKEQEFNQSICKAFPRPAAPLVTAAKIGAPTDTSKEHPNRQQQNQSKDQETHINSHRGAHKNLKFKSDCCLIAKENSLTKLKRAKELHGLEMEGVDIRHQNIGLEGELEVVKGRKIYDLIQQMDRRNETIKMQTQQQSTEIGDVINPKKVNKYNMSFHSNLFRRDRFADDIREEHKKKYASSMDGSSPRPQSNLASTIASEIPAIQQSGSWIPTFKPNKLKRFGFKKSKSIGGFDSGLSLEAEHQHLEQTMGQQTDNQDQCIGPARSPFAQFMLLQPEQIQQEHLELQLNYKQLACMQQRPTSHKQKQARYLVFDSPRRQVSSSRSGQYSRVVRALRQQEGIFPSSLQLRESQSHQIAHSEGSSIRASIIVGDIQAPDDEVLEQQLNSQPAPRVETSGHKAKSNLKSLLAGVQTTIVSGSSPTKHRGDPVAWKKLTQSFQLKSSFEHTVRPSAVVARDEQWSSAVNTPLKLKSLNTTETKPTLRAQQMSGLGARLSKPFTDKKRQLLRTTTTEGWSTEGKVKPDNGWVGQDVGDDTQQRSRQASQGTTNKPERPAGVLPLKRTLLETLQRGVLEAVQQTERMGLDAEPSDGPVVRRPSPGKSGRTVVVRPDDARKLRGVLVINDF